MPNKKERKKFIETKFGKFIHDKFPAIRETVADLLPDKGALGIVKRLIDVDPEVKEQFNAMSPQDKLEFARLEQNHVFEVEKLLAEDRANARAREVEYVKAGKKDWMFLITGCVALLGYMLMVTAVIFYPKHIEHSVHFSQLMGLIEGITLSMFAYYFGTTKMSHEKTKMLIDKE